MPETGSDELAARWYDYWRRSCGSREQRVALESGEPADVVAAAKWINDVVERGGPTAVQMLVALAEAAPDGDDGVTVGVGPVEDLFQRHGDGVVEAVVAQARRSRAFARALSHAHASDVLSATSQSQLAACWQQNQPPT